ncbi:MAG: hypothetical protein RL885_11720 [Planctomycetota bacterium]
MKHKIAELYPEGTRVEIIRGTYQGQKGHVLRPAFADTPDGFEVVGKVPIWLDAREGIFFIPSSYTKPIKVKD